MISSKDIGQKIIKFRVERGWTQTQLAKYLDALQSAVSAMENGKYKWTPLTEARYAKKMPEVFN